MAEVAYNQIGKGVCLIRAGGYKGTGFHYGSGWVMTVAHNFQNDAKDTESIHSLLSKASFTFNVNGKPFVFKENKRMAFIHHLKPGEFVDPDNKDIAMVKLGIQWEYGRSNNEDWEKEEQEQLNEMKLPALAEIDKDQERQVKVGDKVFAIHYGGDDDTMKKTDQTVRAVNDGEVPTIELSPPIPHGASGCPILKQVVEERKLVGLFCGGGEVEDPQATDDALPWKSGIQNYINEGVGIIETIGSYMAYMNMNILERASTERKNLEERAKASKLTVYLTNGDVLNGP